MSSRDRKRAALYEKLQQLRTATHSSSVVFVIHPPCILDEYVFVKL